MGLGDVLKRALGAVGEFDRKVVYGPDYKARAESLAQLNDLNIRGKLLENQGKYEQIQQLKQQLAQRTQQQQGKAFTDAVTLGSNLDASPQPGFVSPENPSANIDQIDPTNILHKPGDGMTEPALPSFIKSQINPADEGTLTAAIREGRRVRRKNESQRDQTFQDMLESRDLRDQNTRSQMELRNTQSEMQRRKMEHPTSMAGMGGGYANVNGGIGAKDGVFGGLVFNKSTGKMEFSPVEGFTPNSTKPTQGTRDALFGVAQSYDNLDAVENAVKKATNILGPLSGRVALGEKTWLGGDGLSPEQVNALTSLDRATMMAAFQNGGKQLTGIELETFLRQYPQPTDTLSTLLTKVAFLKKALKKEALKRKASMTGPEAASIPDWNAMGNVFQPDQAPEGASQGGVPAGWRMVNGVLERIP